MATFRVCVLFAWMATMLSPVTSLYLPSKPSFIRLHRVQTASDLSFKKSNDLLYSHSAEIMLSADLRVRSMIDWFALSRLRGGDGSVKDDRLVDGSDSVKVESNITNSTGPNPVSFLLQSFFNAASAASTPSDPVKKSGPIPSNRDESPNFCEHQVLSFCAALLRPPSTARPSNHK
jgi:hypothetical protein